MAKISFEKGSNVKIRGEFRSPKDAIPPNTLLDPSIVTLTIRKPDKTSFVRTYGTSGIDRISQGIYLSVLSLDQEGTYHWRWQGTNGTESGVISGQLDSEREADF